MRQPPPYRRLRAYTFDPSLATQLDTALINQTVLKVRWEEDLRPGPVGEYLELIDYDPASDCVYEPVDLNDPHLLAGDGLAPSEGDPKFHQQMAYAVAMTTIANFERALGRKVLWAPRLARDPRTHKVTSTPVRKLRIYPHALREANAYYSPEKKALLFGYFPAVLANPGENLPGGLVFTCLSHDVVAHETTHALLDGLHRYFAEPSNPDVLAFHEGFADVVALFQHFTQPEALRHQIAKTRGDLGTRNLLGELAHQFGQAIGNHGALRDAIGRPDPATGEWQPAPPDPEAYQAATEPHDRGAILVAAMFDAFLALYKSRTDDLLRIATGGRGVLPAGNLHPDLVNRLAETATRIAGSLLRMAIRALDYCPPVDVTFGEYLRALVTADWDLEPGDERGYRIAVVEAFRRRGIYPPNVRTLAPDALRWQRPNRNDQPSEVFAGLIRALKSRKPSPAERSGRPGSDKSPHEPDLSTFEWQTSGPRERIIHLNNVYQALAYSWIKSTFTGSEVGTSPESGPGTAPAAMGLALDASACPTIYRGKDGLPLFEVHSVRSARRPREDGGTMIDLIVEIVQRRRGYFDPEKQKAADRGEVEIGSSSGLQPDFVFRGGCTLLIDSETGQVRYCVAKNIRSEARLARQRAFLLGESGSPSMRATYMAANPAEMFAALHRCR